MSTNVPPTANNDSYTTDEDTTLVVPEPGVLGNDSDPDGPNNLTAHLIDDVSHGTLVFYDNGSFVYTPDPDYYGTDWFTYQAFDGLDLSLIHILTLTINSVNDPPVAVDDTASTSVDTPVWIPVLDNDYDPDGSLDPSSVTVISGPSHGTTLVNTSTGDIKYTPYSGYTGSDSFVYLVRDDDGAGDTALVSITIASGGGEELDQYQEAYTSDLSIFSYRVAAQSFTPSKNVLTRVELYLSKVGSPPNPLIVEIRSDLYDPGSVITSTTVSSSIIGSTPSWINIDLSDAMVTPGSKYYIVLRTIGGDAYNRYRWGYADYDNYSGGELWYSSASGRHWSEYSYWDLCFKTYGFNI